VSVYSVVGEVAMSAQETAGYGMFIFGVDDQDSIPERARWRISDEDRRRVGLEIAEDPYVVAVWFSTEEDGTPRGMQRLQVAIDGTTFKYAKEIISAVTVPTRKRIGALPGTRFYQYNFQFVVPEEMALRLNIPYRLDRVVRLGEVLKEPTGGPYPHSPARGEATLHLLPRLLPEGHPGPPKPVMGNVPGASS
jgi:hypothetical protein